MKKSLSHPPTGLQFSKTPNNMTIKTLAAMLPAALLLFSCSDKAVFDNGQGALLDRQLEQSDNIRTLMKEDPSNGAQARWEAKEVLAFRELPLYEDFESLQHTGVGAIFPDKEFTHSGKGSVRLDTPGSTAVKNPTNRNYGTPDIVRPLDGEDLREWNRFSCWVYVDAPGYYLVFLGFELRNEGEKPMPTPGRFEGQHYVTVTPGEWVHVLWEIPDLYRDKVTSFSANMMLSGEPAGAGDMHLYVDDMRLEKVVADYTRGFNLQDDNIAFSHSGYKVGMRKQALTQNIDTQKFTLVNASGRTVYTGKAEDAGNGFALMDFSDFDTPGEYILKIGDRATKPFFIGDEAYRASAWRSINFMFGERCGFDQPGIHQECHQDVLFYHPDGRFLSMAGGWHDAGDLTQGPGNNCEAIMGLLEVAQKAKGHDDALYRRALDEARWGLNWILRTRFGDGYRAGGLVIGIWTLNIRGDKDDMESNATNSPETNLRCAEVLAKAAPMFDELDPVFANWCRKSAIEDFDFALEGFDSIVKKNNETDIHAMAATSAMRLYELTGEQKYIDCAAAWARHIMAGQQLERQEGWEKPLHGYFYESSEKARTLTYYHQSQEYRPVQALALLLKAAPSHPDAAAWMTACKAAADYYKETVDVMAPYGLLPAAIYEVGNTDYSNVSHEGKALGIGLPTMDEYNAEVRNGHKLAENIYLRNFPVAYQFRGFNGVTLCKAKAAFVLADLLDDAELKDIAARQVEWTHGFNPFATSTVWGDGYNYHPLYGAYAGDVVGAVPVGIETFENDDEPYWPTQSNCTYKEVWIHTTGRMLSCVAEMLY